jgi:hypothetical protein
MDGERGEQRHIQLLGAYDLIHKHLSAEVCEEVFAEIRDAERQRKWTLQALLSFWMAVIMEPPRALQHALARVKLPARGATPKRCCPRWTRNPARSSSDASR